jgi:hypothetical protein
LGGAESESELLLSSLDDAAFLAGFCDSATTARNANTAVAGVSRQRTP